MDIILVIVGIALLAFTITMIRLFMMYGYIPDTLVTCVFACLGSECGALAWIKTTKEKRQQREWQIADEERQKEYIKEMQKENDKI